MAIKVVCDICGEVHKVRDERADARMYCKTCDHPVVVPRGPRIPDDVELVEEDPVDVDPEIEEEDDGDWVDTAKSLVGAVFGLVLMGFYLSFTVSYMTGAEGSSSVSGRNRSTSNPPPSRVTFNRPPVVTPPIPGNDGRSDRRSPPPKTPEPAQPPRERVTPRPTPPPTSSDQIAWLNAFEVSPADGLVATGHRDGVIRIWNVRGELQRELRGHSDSVSYLRFTPEGSRIVSVGSDGTLRMWGVRRGLALGQVALPSVNRSQPAVSASGRRAAVAGTRGDVHLVDVVDQRLVSTLNVGPEWPYDFVGEDRFLTVGASGRWAFRDDSGRPLRTGRLDGSGSVAGAASPSGLLAVAVAGSGVVRLVDSGTGVEREPIPVEVAARVVRFSPSGAYVACVLNNRKLLAYDVSVDPAQKVFEAENAHIGVGFHGNDTLVYAIFDQADRGRPRMASRGLPRPAGPVDDVPKPDPLPDPEGRVTSPPTAPGDSRLVTDASQPIVISALEPTTAEPGDTLVIRGKGFEKTQAVAFGSWRTRTDPEMAVREFEVVSDEEIRVTVPDVVSRQRGGSIVEVYTPEGVGVTWPADTQILKADDDEAKTFGFAFVTRGTRLRDRPSSTNVFLDEGTSTGGLFATRAYVRAGAVVEGGGSSNGIVASKRSTVRAQFDPKTSINVPDVYPSFLPEILNQK